MAALMSARPASSYRSVASAVRARLLDLQSNGTPRVPPDELERARIDTVRELLWLGHQYAPRPGALLDTTRSSSPVKLDLARELVRAVPRRLPRFEEKGEDFDMREWVNEAVPILNGMRNGLTWNDLEPEQRKFVETEFLPFLKVLLSTPPEPPRW